MGLDIRIPIGLMFAAIGIVLVLAGFVIDEAAYQRSLGLNVNLIWGSVLVAFGVVMLLLGFRGGPTVRPTEESIEGKKIEELERLRGLEAEAED